MKHLTNILVIISLILCWQAIIIIFNLPPFILPSPFAVLTTIIKQASLLITHTGITIIEMCSGLFLGTMLGIFTAILMAMNRYIQQVLKPLIVISQSLPTFAIAPIFIFWLGYGLNSKLIITAFMIFFPIASNLFDGLQQTPQHWLDNAKTMNATRWQMLRHIRFPAALPALASGLRIATAMAPIGAIIGEWVGASQGLGFLMLEANARSQIDLVFACLMILSLFSISLYLIIDKLLKHFINW